MSSTPAAPTALAVAITRRTASTQAQMDDRLCSLEDFIAAHAGCESDADGSGSPLGSGQLTKQPVCKRKPELPKRRRPRLPLLDLDYARRKAAATRLRERRRAGTRAAEPGMQHAGATKSCTVGWRKTIWAKSTAKKSRGKDQCWGPQVDRVPLTTSQRAFIASLFRRVDPQR